ncbi:hypothetical protein KM915_20980 [Cytobacillus oceanisediminis]|uniref:hypothetical protein n=1 Tax=Cytobacillus oceanisediminis TaxID=665099 RepID=UPI001C21A266|nr:hypothetical protein [Cytobacillus oceanisediminis]MBU8732526.1 hypothetical protein [Cytobacillus oceanisediminis]
MSILKQKRNPFTSFFLPQRIIADMVYPNYSIEERNLNTVRFLLSPIEHSEKQYLLMIIPNESISPMQYGYETFSLIDAFLDCYNLKLQQVEVVLDYAERTRVYPKNTLSWNFILDRKGKYSEDKLSEIPLGLLEIVEATRKNYYEEFNSEILKKVLI